ncbi:hypothetical protein [Natronospora cellulosivora (SeqCode)]
MKKIVLSLAIILMFVFITITSLAEIHEEELLSFLSQFEDMEYEARDWAESFGEDKCKKFLDDFFDDFIKGNVEFIKPYHKTDDIADYELQSFMGRFPDFSFWQGRISYRDFEETEYMVMDRKIPHYNFKVYEIDFTMDGTYETIFYSSGYRNSRSSAGYAKYDLLNWHKNDSASYESKHAIGAVLIRPEYEGKNKERTGNFNGIIKYDDTYYIYEVWRLDDSMIVISFEKWNKSLERVSAKASYTIRKEVDNK